MMQQLQSDEIKDIVTSLIKAQVALKPAIKDSVNPFHKSKYADINSVFSACREALAENDLGVVQGPVSIDGSYYLVTTLYHVSGQWLRSFTPLLTDKLDSQSIGKAITYARRYGLSALLGIVTEVDDDAESITDHTPSKPTYKPQTQPKAGPSKSQEDFLSLKILLDAEGIDTSVLTPYITHLSKQSNKPSARVIESALRPELTERFKERYLAYLEQFSPQSVVA